MDIEVVTLSEEDGPGSCASTAAAVAARHDGGEIDSVEAVDPTIARQIQADSRACVTHEGAAQAVAGAETDVEPQQNLGAGPSGEVAGGSGGVDALVGVDTDI